MRFSDIPGQQQAKSGLLTMWQNNHFPHALLLSGREGVGGLPMALALAQYIFCENKSETDSCGKCAACSKVSRLEHADLHLSYPTVTPKPGTKAMSKHFIEDFRDYINQTPYSGVYNWLQFINAENKQGNITAEECREIIDQLNLKSYEGGPKVQLIWMAEYLGKEGNILLKLIEEPPADTFLVLIAENTGDILPTIISRTQLIRLSPLSPQSIADKLSSGNIDASRAIQIGQMSQGSYAEALRLLQHTENDLFPEVRSWFNSLFTNNGIELTRFAEDWSKSGREQQKNFLHYIIQLLEQTIRVTYLPEGEYVLPVNELEFVKKLSSIKLPLEAMNNIVTELTKAIYYIERNAHSKTQLLALSIRVVYIIQGKEHPTI